ncbi:MAG: tetratricopeptide repeat protein, partial [Myxococcota bacterium]
ATQYLDAEPDDQRLLDLRAQAYDASMQYENALGDLEIVSAENPDTPILIERLLNLHIQIEDWDGARERIAELKALLDRPGTDRESRIVFCATAAQFEQQRGEIEVAEQTVRDCLEEFPADPQLAFALVGLLDSDGRSEEGTNWLAELVEKYPKRMTLVHGHAARLDSLGRSDEAEAILLALAEKAPTGDTWVAIANRRVEEKDLVGAGEALDEAIEIMLGQSASDPELDWSRLLAESRFGLGDVYIRAGRQETAERIIDSLSDEPAMALLLRGRLKLENGDAEGALADYQEGFKTFPSNAAARYLAGRAAVEIGDYDLALIMFQDALRAAPTGTDAGFVMAQMLAAEGRYSWAIDALSFRSARAPDGDPVALRMTARLAAAAALHKYAEAVRASLSNSLAWVGIALADQAHDIEVVLGPEAAIKYLDAVDELEEPGYHEAFSAWYRLAIRLDREDEARKRLAALVEANPDVAGVLLIQARALADEGRIEESRDVYADSVAQDGSVARVHYEHGQVLARLGETDAAIEAFDRASALEDVDGGAAFAAAKTLYDVDRLDEAAERLRELVVSRPFHGAGALLLVEIAKKQGRAQSEEAYVMARQANRYHMHAGPSAHLEFGALALDREEFEPAREAFSVAISKSHAVADALFGRARALAGLGRNAAAIRDLEAALDEDGFGEADAASVLLDSLRAKEGRS